jgi:low affinity Fe/Cu permease
MTRNKREANKNRSAKSRVARPATRAARNAEDRLSKNVKSNRNHDWFSRLAFRVAHLSGRPIAFGLAVLVVLAWSASGPIFRYSDTWQLVINTGTTIVTFLMVFLIQNTQDRDTLALQVKLSELILVIQGAQNRLATAEDLSDIELDELHNHYRRWADETFESLAARRRAKAAEMA